MAFTRPNFGLTSNISEIINNSIEFCDVEQPPVVDPPVKFSCIYEWIAGYQCHYQNMPQDWNAQWFPGTYNSLTPKGNHVPTMYGKPFANRHLVGLVTNANWALIKNSGMQIGVWTTAPSFKPYQTAYKIIRMYTEVNHTIPADEAQGWQCPAVPDAATFPQMPGGAIFNNLGVKCPTYYELRPCQTCKGQSRDDLSLRKYVSVPPGQTIAGPYIFWDDDWTQGGKPKLPGTTYTCWTPTLLNGAPGKIAGQAPNQYQPTVHRIESHNYENFNDCSICLDDLIVMFTKCGHADPNWFTNASRLTPAGQINEGKVYKAIMDGNAVFKRMTIGRAWPSHELLYNTYAAAGGYYYKGNNGNCWQASFIPCASANYIWAKTLTTYVPNRSTNRFTQNASTNHTYINIPNALAIVTADSCCACKDDLGGTVSQLINCHHPPPQKPPPTPVIPPEPPKPPEPPQPPTVDKPCMASNSNGCCPSSNNTKVLKLIFTNYGDWDNYVTSVSAAQRSAAGYIRWAQNRGSTVIMWTTNLDVEAWKLKQQGRPRNLLRAQLAIDAQPWTKLNSQDPTCAWKLTSVFDNELRWGDIKKYKWAKCENKAPDIDDLRKYPWNKC